MTSTVTNFSNKIDTGYPKAGVNNDSQGFRTNFSNIYNALSVAASEITSLQVNGVNLNNPVNDLGWASVITRAQLQNSGGTFNAASSSTNIAGDIEVNYALGSYQEVSVASTATSLKITNWPPSGVYANIRLNVISLTTGTITFNGGTGVVHDDGDIPYLSTASVVRSSVWEVWTADSGNNIYVNRIGGPFN